MSTYKISGLSLLWTLALVGNAQAASMVLKPSSNMNVADGVIQIGQGGTVNLDPQLVLDEGNALPGAYGGSIVVSYDSRRFAFDGFAPNGVTYFCNDPQPLGG